jgi:hypothetical protein
MALGIGAVIAEFMGEAGEASSLANVADGRDSFFSPG